MMFFESMGTARKVAREISGTYRKVSGGWLVMNWRDYYIWRGQK